MTKGTRSMLDELLSDPMVQMVMERDRVRPEDLREMLERDRRRRLEKRAVPPAHMIAACRMDSLCC